MIQPAQLVKGCALKIGRTAREHLLACLLLKTVRQAEGAKKTLAAHRL